MTRAAGDSSDLQKATGARIDLAFTTVGRGTSVLFLHGTSANHAVWRPIADTLADRAHSILLDQRGHGYSDKPEHGYDAAPFAADAIGILDALKIQKAIIVGHSLGARNAWVAAAHHSDRVAAVLAVDYVPYVEQEVLDVLRERVAAGDREFSTESKVVDYLAHRYPLMPRDAIERRCTNGYRQDVDGSWRPLASASALDLVVEGLREPWEDEFVSAPVPLVCIRGAKSAIVTPAAWNRAQRARPNARWSTVDGADHYVPEERPEVIVREISALLDSV